MSTRSSGFYIPKRTFADYCRERWDMGRTYAFYQIESAQIVDHLRVHHGEHLPTSERQCRPLTKLRTKNGDGLTRNADALENGGYPNTYRVPNGRQERREGC